ncbi:hypothetical protein [Pseudobacteroides cellulosolvens]|uniref:Uncharacterized protein n=1 Tax=Pseudobacteroides cellulosolvens ATCC 35603 = DSM 2933 TaxID=398512 RepID=A0A0L6JWN9_9FIRM|nr:hypothetical protein [Pseudobacteroides cellulosolvens]KNY30159.1 hypothetical protein Bccel_5436 [Pseudobacteroides cellulosolvens ATCC 35603 = DSM 2933]
MQKSEIEVREFLTKVHNIIEDSYNNLKILDRTQGVDKTREFRNLYNIKHDMICEQILALDVTNYSYTDYDDNPKWKCEEVWFFGQTLSIEGVNNRDIIYIKLKLRNNVICMSFHPQEFKLRFPYL